MIKFDSVQNGNLTGLACIREGNQDYLGKLNGFYNLDQNKILLSVQAIVKNSVISWIGYLNLNGELMLKWKR